MKCTNTIASGIVEALAGGTSILDISDGLARAAHRISKASGVPSEINSRDLHGFEAALEQAAMRLEVSPADWVRFGGEDHSLLATFPEGVVIPREFKPIGRVVAQTEHLVTLDGIALQQNGWDSIRG